MFPSFTLQKTAAARCLVFSHLHDNSALVERSSLIQMVRIQGLLSLMTRLSMYCAKMIGFLMFQLWSSILSMT